MIIESQPSDWKDLQLQVAQILSECGYEVAIETTVDSARHEVEIDVMVKEIVGKRANLILIECKNWKKAIPQSVVHSFRAVMSDVGANYGYIIAKEGFQSGAFKAAKYSNIELLTWYEFQSLFENE